MNHQQLVSIYHALPPKFLCSIHMIHIRSIPQRISPLIAISRTPEQTSSPSLNFTFEAGGAIKMVDWRWQEGGGRGTCTIPSSQSALSINCRGTPHLIQNKALTKVLKYNWYRWLCPSMSIEQNPYKHELLNKVTEQKLASTKVN